MRDAKRGVQLYVKRVFIMDNCEALIPEYLRFVKGVVDANDLSLNISREILQQDRQIELIRKRLVRKVLTTIKSLQSDDADKYATLWTELGRAIKEGLLSDQDNRDTILEICSFDSTHDADKPTTLRDYLSRMPEGQDAIYYATGESRATLEHSPHMEAFKAKGYEVLLLTDPVDEVWIDVVPEFDGKPLTSIARGEVDLGGDDVSDETQVRPGRSGHLARHHPGRRGQAGPAVPPAHHLGGLPGRRPRRHVPDPGEDVPGHGPGTAQDQADPRAQPDPPADHRPEVRPRRLTGRPGLVDTAKLLYGMALLAEGGELADPAAFVATLTSRLENSLG